jgi:hypothetical protein
MTLELRRGKQTGDQTKGWRASELAMEVFNQREEGCFVWDIAHKIRFKVKPMGWQQVSLLNTFEAKGRQ